MLRPCPCASPRTAAFFAGLANLVIGMTGLSLLALNPLERHLILDPVQPLSVDSAKYNDIVVEDTLQFFIEYLLPAVGILTLGLVLIVASATMNRCLIVFSFLLSTLLMAGCVSGLLSLTISGVDPLSAIPLIFSAIIQCYFYWVVIDFNQFSWDFTPKEDKQNLVEMKSRV